MHSRCSFSSRCNLLPQFAQARFRGLQLLLARLHVLTLRLTGRLDLPLVPRRRGRPNPPAPRRAGSTPDDAVALAPIPCRCPRRASIRAASVASCEAICSRAPASAAACSRDRTVELGQCFLELLQLLLPGIGLRHLLGQLRTHPLQDRRLLLQTFAQLVVLAQAEGHAKFAASVASIPGSAAPWPLAA